MTVPLHLKAAGITKTMLLSKRAIKERLESRSWVVREGVPNMNALPDDGDQAISVWYFPRETRADQEGQSSMWHSEVFATQWVITIVTPDTERDVHATSSDRIVEASGDVLEALTSTMAGVSLDGSVNWSDQYNIKFGIAQNGGDRSSTVASLTLLSHHPIFPNRTPPGVA